MNQLRDLDKPNCNCGIVGVFNHPQASVMAYYALHALQHRGQEAAGIVAAKKNGDDDINYRGEIQKLKGNIAEIRAIENKTKLLINNDKLA